MPTRTGLARRIAAGAFVVLKDHMTLAIEAYNSHMIDSFVVASVAHCKAKLKPGMIPVLEPKAFASAPKRRRNCT